MSKKALASLLTSAQRGHLTAAATLCDGVVKRNAEVKTQCFAHFRVVFPSRPHIRQVEKYKEAVKFLKGDRKGGDVPYELQLFYKWVKDHNEGLLPGQKKAKRKAVSAAVWKNATDERFKGLDNMMRQARTGDFISTKTIAMLHDAVQRLKACKAAIDADYKENERMTRAAAKAERTGKAVAI